VGGDANENWNCPWGSARLWLYPLAFALSTFIWAWVEYPSVSQFFSDHRQMLSLIFGWVSVGMMGILVIIGQLATARRLIPLTQVTATMGLAVDLKAAEHGSYP
jgi:hypothetical protein